MQEGKPIGVISIGDVVKAIVERQNHLISRQAFKIGQLKRYISVRP